MAYFGKSGHALVQAVAPGGSEIESSPSVTGELMKTTWTRDAEHNLTQNDDVVGSEDTVAVIFD